MLLTIFRIKAAMLATWNTCTLPQYRGVAGTCTICSHLLQKSPSSEAVKGAEDTATSGNGHTWGCGKPTR